MPGIERRIEVSTTTGVAYAVAREVLLDEPGAVFADSRTDDRLRGGHVIEELSVDLGAGAAVHQAVVLQFGAPRSTEAGLALPLAWHATGREELLPTFNGELELSRARSRARLGLRGLYTVPLGIVGRLGDDAVGRRLARRSLTSLVERFAGRLELEVKRRVRTAGPQGRSEAELQGNERSEIYIG